MATLCLNRMGQLCLTLQGEADNPILATVRRWPHWTEVTSERDPANQERYLSVTLYTDPMHESTIREILKRSFNLTFPDIGTKHIEIDSKGRHVRTRRTS